MVTPPNYRDKTVVTDLKLCYTCDYVSLKFMKCNKYNFKIRGFGTCNSWIGDLIFQSRKS